MPDLYRNPVFYGIQDVSLADGRSARVMYPSAENYVFDAPLLDGTYPLIVFAHGSRKGSSDAPLCPKDDTQDYKRWTSVLHLLARCGFVVVAPALHNELPQPEAASEVLEQTVRWMHSDWDGRSVLVSPSVFTDPDRYRLQASKSGDDLRVQLAGLGAGIGIGIGSEHALGMATPVGLIGHSWGARAAALAAANRNVSVDAFASIAGAFDSNEAIWALERIRSTLLVAGALDSLNVSYLTPLWSQMQAPKSQVLLAGADHWSWFSPDSGLHPCDIGDESAYCPIAWQVLAVVLLNFMAKHLLNDWMVPPHLLGSPGGRPSLVGRLRLDRRCALKVRWDDPLSVPTSGDRTFGFWSQNW
jgi:dienelactone hydrolase